MNFYSGKNILLSWLRRLGPGLACLALATAALAQAAEPPVVIGKFAPLDAIIEQAIAEGLPGAVCLIGHNGQIVYRRAYGSRSLEPSREPMMVDTIFDLASLTKSIATATSVMRLLELGKVRLNDPVTRYLPEFGKNGKKDVNVRQLMTHYSGLREDLDLRDSWQGTEPALERAYDEKLVSPPGARFRYSDINYIVLGAIVEKVSGMRLNEFAESQIFLPLGMTHTRFLPPQEWRSSIAPTEYEGEAMLRGIVHDPTARRMGGVAGHAGLFSTADDLAIFAQNMLSPGKVLSPATVEKMTTPQQPPSATILRGLGWDIDSPFSSNRGELLPVGSYGHTGFTGTSIWIDPFSRTYIILLTNAVHPREGKSVVSLRSRVATSVAALLNLRSSQSEQFRLAGITGYNEQAAGTKRPISRNGNVLTGIDVLEAANFAQLRNLPRARARQQPRPEPGSDARDGSAQDLVAVGLLTNQTGVDAQGRRTIDVLAHAKGIKLAAIFSPEHGSQGVLDTTEIGNSSDPATGIPIYSVYGDTEARRRPSLDIIRQLDAVVVDIQDAGVRFYTYETTVGYFLEAVARAGNSIVVLDRPNPLSGSVVDGPLLDRGKESFIGYFPLPVRHGMTMGELARLFNGERKIGASLVVVPAQGLMPGDWYDATGLAWVNPSPNLRNLTEATLYPGVALIEGSNVSVGRGTDTPFEVVGAPWINGRELARYLNARQIAGVRFLPLSFTPAASTYANQACQGISIVLLDRIGFESSELGIELASALHALYAKNWKIEKMMPLLGNQAAYDALFSGIDPRRIADDWRDPVDRFQALRRPYLLYEEAP